jgi:hypothetical protein
VGIHRLLQGVAICDLTIVNATSLRRELVTARERGFCQDVEQNGVLSVPKRTRVRDIWRGNTDIGTWGYLWFEVDCLRGVDASSLIGSDIYHDCSESLGLIVDKKS